MNVDKARAGSEPLWSLESGDTKHVKGETQKLAIFVNRLEVIL
jgi:hypothetical protein